MFDELWSEIADSQGEIFDTPMTAEELVNEFLSANPHFVGAGPSGTGSQSSVSKANGQMGSFDIDNLNMNDPAHRAIYKEHMKTKGIRI